MFRKIYKKCEIEKKKKIKVYFCIKKNANFGNLPLPALFSRSIDILLFPILIEKFRFSFNSQ